MAKQTATKTNTKAPPVEERKSNQVPATKDAVNQMVKELNSEVIDVDDAASTGRGLSQDQADNAMPLLYVLQGLSPQVNKRNEAYVEGAEAGHFWLKGLPRPIVDGAVGIVFQPCAFEKAWVEWVPRDDGGGFVARYDKLPEAAEESVDDENPNIKRYHMPNGNEVIETRYHIGNVYIGKTWKARDSKGEEFILTDGVAVPYVMPFKGTGHQVSRNLMTAMNLKTTATGGRVDGFRYVYTCKTKHKKNKKGEWFLPEFEDYGKLGKMADVKRGESLYNAFNASEVRIGDEVDAGGGKPAGGTAEDGDM